MEQEESFKLIKDPPTNTGQGAVVQSDFAAKATLSLYCGMAVTVTLGLRSL